MTDEQQETTLEMIRIEDSTIQVALSPGRQLKDRTAIASVFAAKKWFL